MILSATATYFDLHISELVLQATGTVVVRADFGTERDVPYCRKKHDFSCQTVTKFYYFEEKVLVFEWTSDEKREENHQSDKCCKIVQLIWLEQSMQYMMSWVQSSLDWRGCRQASSVPVARTMIHNYAFTTRFHFDSKGLPTHFLLLSMSSIMTCPISLTPNLEMLIYLGSKK